MDFFLDCLYRSWLDCHFAGLALLTVGGLWHSFAQTRPRWRGLAVSLLLVVIALNQPALRQARPAVYYDEFYYASTAYNLAVAGRATPFCEQGYPVQEKRLDYPCPPYPTGWPHLVSLAWRSGVGTEAGEAGSAWMTAVRVNRILFCLAPLVLFWALQLRYSWRSAALIALLVPAIPALQRLAQGGSAELAAFFSLLLAYWAWCVWRRGRRGWQLAWLALALAWVAEMRPEGLIWVGLAAGTGSLWWLRQSQSASRAGLVLALVLLVAGIAPAALVLAAHPSASDHHFEAIPRQHMTMNVNRAHNVVNNAWALVDNKIWPLGLTALAVLGVCLSAGRSRWLWVGVALALTAFLSWFPFGDYDCIYSTDTWRFTYHLVLPALALGAEACAALEAHPSKWAGAAVVACLVVVGSGLFCPNQFLARPLPLEHLWEQGRACRNYSGSSPVVSKDLSLYQMLRFGCNLPATLAPLEAVPPEGALLFRVIEADTVENSSTQAANCEQNVQKSVHKCVNRAEISWQTGEKQSFVQNYADASESIIIEQTMWERMTGDLQHWPVVEIYLVRKGL